MTSLTRTPAALTAYLRRATWGLPRARQQELWDELEEHVLTRVDHLCALGADPEQALAQALRELGPPSRVSAGMTQVYLMPKVLLSAGAAALALSAALYALAGGGGPISTLPTVDTTSTKPACFHYKGSIPKEADVAVMSQRNGVLCITPDPRFYATDLVSLRAFKSALESQGGQARFLTSTQLEVKLPNGGGGTLDASFTQDGQAYMRAAVIVSRLRAPQAITARGFTIPEVQIGDVRLKIGDGAQPGIGEDFYKSLATLLINRLVTPKREESQRLNAIGFLLNEGGIPTHAVQTGLNPGEVVMLVTRARQGENEYLGDIAPVEPDGSVRVVSSSSRLRFVPSLAQLSPYPSGGRVPALLVRVTNVPLNNLKQGIFLPPQATSDAAH